MMWICKFDPYVGNMTQGVFKTKEAAEKVYHDASDLLEEKADHGRVYIPFCFTDDYGFAFTINLVNHAIVLMELAQSVKMEGILQKEINSARGVTSSVPQKGFVQQPAGLVRPQ